MNTNWVIELGRLLILIVIGVLFLSLTDHLSRKWKNDDEEDDDETAD